MLSLSDGDEDAELLEGHGANLAAPDLRARIVRLPRTSPVAEPAREIEI
jgi:hypothetical protein